MKIMIVVLEGNSVKIVVAQGVGEITEVQEGVIEVVREEVIIEEMMGDLITVLSGIPAGASPPSYFFKEITQKPRNLIFINFHFLK